MTGIERQIEDKRDYGRAVCQRLTDTIAKLGFPMQNPNDLPLYDSVEFSVVTDPFTQSRDLVGYWYGAGKQRVGQIQFHGDGSFYAEYDVVKPHPLKKKLFVEAVTAWGSRDAIKSEARLLDLPE